MHFEPGTPFSVPCRTSFRLTTPVHSAECRVPTNLKNLENLEMSGNSKIEPQNQGKVDEFGKNSETQGKVRDFFRIISCRPSVSHF